MPATITPPALLTADQAADYLGVAPQTLSKWRCTGEQRIPFIRVGRRVKYRREALDAWLQSRTIEHTGEAPAG